MCRFRVPDEADLPEDLWERIEAGAEKAGFTPNVFRALAYRPSHFRAFFAYYDALVEDTELEREEVEMTAVAVSGVNNCLYCVVAHGALVRLHAEAPRLADQLATNHRTAEVGESHRAMLDFAVTLTERPAGPPRRRAPESGVLRTRSYQRHSTRRERIGLRRGTVRRILINGRTTESQS